jgi:hypothetical protein
MISVPCSACAKPIRFQDRACRACGAVVPASLRNALETRLEASDEDFREAKQRVRSAALTALILGLLHIGWPALRFVLARTGASAGVAADAGDVAALVADCLIGGVMLACFAWARRAPLPALLTAFLVWAGVHGVAALLSPATLLSGPFLKITGAVLLARGILSAWKASTVLRRLARTPA